MTAADIYESAKERIRAVLLPPDSSRAILAVIRLRRSEIGGIDREAVEVLLATLERLAADLLEARERIAFLEQRPLYSNRMKIERLAPPEAPNGAPVSFGWKVGWVADQLVEARLEIAALLGQQEGALPGWEWNKRYGGFVRRNLECRRNLWCHQASQGIWGWSIDAHSRGDADTPRKAMRAAEEVLRAGGML